MKKLETAFYRQEDVTSVARQLLGKVLVTRFEGTTTAGRIVETEAYRGLEDRASHAYGGRRTARTEVMYQNGGVAYVYLCYGIHHLFNVVTNGKGTPHAVLIRALEPLEGIDTMLRRRQKSQFEPSLTRGPGSLSAAMGIFTLHSGLGLRSQELFIGEDAFGYSPQDIIASPRIGVDYAGEDAMLPYRFYVRGNAFVSGKVLSM